MRILHWDHLVSGKETIKEDIGLAIGVFDGVHIGHQQLLNSINSKGIIPTIITFTTNPALILKTRSFHGNILTLEQKLTKLELFGIRLAILIDFSHDFSKISGKEFWISLFRCLHVKKVALGHNFRFGHKRESSSETLKVLSPGLTVDVIRPVFYKGSIVSSTRIRTSIHEGNFQEVQAMTGTRYTLDLNNIRGRITGIALKQGITKRQFHAMEQKNTPNEIYEVNLKETDQVIPGNGNYSALLDTDNGTLSCDISIKDRIIQVKKDADYTNIKKIIFIKRS